MLPGNSQLISSEKLSVTKMTGTMASGCLFVQEMLGDKLPGQPPSPWLPAVCQAAGIHCQVLTLTSYIEVGIQLHEGTHYLPPHPLAPGMPAG